MQRTAIFTGFGFGARQFKDLYKIWQNNELLIYYFNNIAEVAAPIMKYVDAASNVKIGCNIPEVQKLLNNPNGYQSWDNFISTIILYKRLLGNAIINGLTTIDLRTSRSAPRQLFILSPQFTSIIVSQNQDWRLNYIQKYVYDSLEGNRSPLEIDPIGILHLKEVNPNFVQEQYFFGESRYCSCAKNIECITSSYQTKADLYQGPQLIITGKSQGEFSSANTSGTITEVQKAMKKYGNMPGQYKNLITDVALDVFKASFNVAELQLNENNIADFNRLCDSQNVDARIFSDILKSPYANKEAAESSFYNHSFKSEMNSTIHDIQEWLRMWWPSLELIPDYSQITAITKANLEENNRLLDDCKLGLMTRNDYNVAVGKDIIPLPEFNEYRVFIPNQGWILDGQNNNNVQNGNIGQNNSSIPA
jgi:hypothetical protein